MNRFVILNGEVVDKEEINLSFFFWKEKTVVSQKMWFGFGGIPFFAENIDLLVQQIEILKLPCPELLNDKRELFRITKRMLNKNKFYRSGYVWVQIFWEDDQLNTLISSEAFKTFDFPLKEKGILVNFSELKKFSENNFYRFSFFNETFWKVAGSQNRGTIYQNSIILNENNSVCEIISSNLFFISKETLITPSVKTGCFEDILRPVVIETAKKTGLKIIESGEITKEQVFGMDEIFTVSEAEGMLWVLGVENKRYIRNKSIQIHEKLNDYLKEEAS